MGDGNYLFHIETGTTTYTGATENTDYNICLRVDANNSTFDQYCQNVATGKWYGDTNFYFYDETTGSATTATIDFNGTQYTGTSFYLPSTQITNGATTNTQITFTITKTGYGTRTYTTDMNKFTNLTRKLLDIR